MRIIASPMHRLLDFVTVVGFAVAPSLLGLTGGAATLSYALAAIHLILTLLTHFPGSPGRPVPLSLHGVIEGIVGLALVALPFLAKWSGPPRTFYLAAGIVILVVWALSNYRTTGTGTGSVA